MRICVALAVFLAVAAVGRVSGKCCPQPENDDAGKCGCCPDACCCICKSIVVPGTAAPFTTPMLPPLTTSEVCQLTGLDIMFVVDNSASIDDMEWMQALDALEFIVSSPLWASVGNETRFGMIIYSNEPELIFGINSVESDSVANLVAAISGADGVRNLTGTPFALRDAAIQLESFDRNDTFFPDVAMVITDGRSNVPLPPNTAGALMMYADRLKAEAVVYALGVGPSVNQDELDIIGDFTATVEDFERLNSTIDMITRDLALRICETIQPDPRTTMTPPTTPGPTVVEDCKCCCPPLPDPCDKKKYGHDACCCRFNHK